MLKNGSHVLVIGATSKIAKAFLARHDDDGATMHVVCRNPEVSSFPETYRTYAADLGDQDSVASLASQLSSVTFDTVLFFASTYDHDSAEPTDLLAQYHHDLQTNALSFAFICKSVQLSKASRIIALGDSGLEHPKKGYTSYSLSKIALEGVIKILAMELSPGTAVNIIRLGPTVTDKDDNAGYYGRALLDTMAPVEGLLGLLDFLLETADLNMTGTTINYDGGTYLSRVR